MSYLKLLNFATIVFFGLYSNLSVSQVSDNIKFKLAVGQSVDNALTRSKPAVLSAILPSDTTSSSQSIRGFVELGISLLDRDKVFSSTTLFLERHKNTLISKKQDVFQAGAQFSYHFFRHGGETQRFKLHFLATAKYSNNYIDEKESGQYLLNFNLVPKDPKNTFFDALLNNEIAYPQEDYANFISNSANENSDYKLKPSDFIQFSGIHNIGLNYITNPSLLLLNAGYSLKIYPLSGIIYRLFEQYRTLDISLGINHWEQIGNKDTDRFVGTNFVASLGFNFLISEKNKHQIGIRYAYNEGGDPLKGLTNQLFREVSLSIVFVLPK